MTDLRAGAEAVVDGLCGCQFLMRPLRIRLIKVLDYVTLGPDLVWVQVYRLDKFGDAVESRELLVITPAFVAACARGIPWRELRQTTPEEVSYVDA